MTSAKNAIPLAILAMLIALLAYMNYTGKIKFDNSFNVGTDSSPSDAPTTVLIDKEARGGPWRLCRCAGVSD